MFSYLRTGIVFLICIFSLGAPRMIHASPALNDSQIALLILIGGDGEIQMASRAKDTSKNQDVIAFSDRMITAHAAAIEEFETLLNKNAIVPSESDQSQALVTMLEAKDAELALLRDKEFDMAFMESQVKMKEECLNRMNTELIPITQNAEMKTHLAKLAQKTQEWLEEAKATRAKIQ